MPKYKYKTTTGLTTHLEGGVLEQEYPDDPRQPDGDGWELLSTVVADGRLYWTWRRKVE